MEGLIPIAMAAWMALYPSPISFSRMGRERLTQSFFTLRSQVGRADLTQSFVTLRSQVGRADLTQSFVTLRSQVGRADLSSQSPVALCRSPLLSTSLTIPLKLSQGYGHGSRHHLAATVRPLAALTRYLH
jgi:hypothetical protein